MDRIPNGTNHNTIPTTIKIITSTKVTIILIMASLDTTKVVKEDTTKVAKEDITLMVVRVGTIMEAKVDSTSTIIIKEVIRRRDTTNLTTTNVAVSNQVGEVVINQGEASTQIITTEVVIKITTKVDITR